MNRLTTVAILLAGAVLEAGGDALVRAGQQPSSLVRQIGLFAAGAVTLFVYAYLINAAPWDFGRLIGIYVVFFFLVAQVVAWLAFHQTPSGPMLVGGALIVLGGLIMTRG